MLPRRTSSRARYVEYLAKRKTDAQYAKRSHDEKSPDRFKRTRPFSRLFRDFWELLRGHHGTVVAALATLSVVALIGLAIPASTKIAIDYIITDSPGPAGLPAWVRERFHINENRSSLLWALGGVMVFLAILGVLFGTWGRFQMTRLTKRVQVHLRHIAFEHAVRLPLHRVHHYKSGGMSSLLREDAGQAGDLLFSMIYNPWRAIVQLVGTLTILAVVDWRMLLGATALLPAVWLSHKTWISRIRPVYRDIKTTRIGIDSSTTEAFGGMRVVRGFGQHRAELVRFGRAQHYMARLEMLTWWWSRMVEIAWAVMIPLASAAVLVYGGREVLRGALTIGDVMMFSTYLLMLLGPLETLTSTATNIQTNLAGLDRVLDLLEEPVEFEREGTPVSADAKVEIDPAAAMGRIELRDVWFAYPKGKKSKPKAEQAPAASEKHAGRNGTLHVPQESITAAKRGTSPHEARGEGAEPAGNAGPSTSDEPEFVIKGVSLHVEPGDTIAFVGASGSGKTTLCNLIARFFDPTRGSIHFDGVDLTRIDVDSYRRILGIVEQDVFLFDGTVEENIGYGKRDATREQIIEAAKAANAHDFITKLDDGYETLIGERGVRLSGGQKQRLAIARALVADPVVLILDEATSNLDAESEALIQASLGRLMEGRTSFVIAHRLSTIRHADRIVVMDQGEIREIGTHDQLLAAGGRYAELLRTQIEAHLIPGVPGVTATIGQRS